jgi:hypothetical protein
MAAIRKNDVARMSGDLAVHLDSINTFNIDGA